MRVALIGYRGCGKSTVARRLALALGWDWLDADVELELRPGKSIAAIFADDGEEAFRDLESDVLDDLLRRERMVLALGGGVVLRERNRRALADSRVVWLTAAVETLQRRLAADVNTFTRRPNLTAGGGPDEVRRLLAERTPLYRACAELTVDTEHKTPDQAAAEIVERLGLVRAPQETG